MSALTQASHGTLIDSGSYYFGADLASGSDRTVISKPTQSAVAPGLLSQAMALATNERITDPKKRIYKIREVGANEGYIQSNITNPDCGHTMNPAEHPKHVNCASCWYVFFHLHPAIVAAAKSAIETLGDAGVKRAFGKKFLKAYNRFAEGQQ
jgi:hypothetical protein